VDFDGSIDSKIGCGPSRSAPIHVALPSPSLDSHKVAPETVTARTLTDASGLSAKAERRRQRPSGVGRQTPEDEREWVAEHQERRRHRRSP
jgi:hypothetical protein